MAYRYIKFFLKSALKTFLWSVAKAPPLAKCTGNSRPRASKYPMALPLPPKLTWISLNIPTEWNLYAKSSQILKPMMYANWPNVAKKPGNSSIPPLGRKAWKQK